jgi:hypothetical protein
LKFWTKLETIEDYENLFYISLYKISKLLKIMKKFVRKYQLKINLISTKYQLKINLISTKYQLKINFNIN